MADFLTDTRHYFSKAIQRIDLKEPDKAIISYHLSRNGISDNIVYLNIALAYCLKEDFHKAVKNYSISLAIKPNSTVALNGAGFCLFNLGKYEEAILKFKKAAEVNPKYIQGRLNWGLVLYCMKEEAEAKKIIEQAIADSVLSQSLLKKTDIVERYEFQLSLAEARLAKAENEERKMLLEEQICGYRWILEFAPRRMEEFEELYYDQDLYL